MDADRRELERRCREMPADATAWAALTRDFLRAGDTANALATLRIGFRHAPVATLVDARRDVLATLRAPTYRKLWDRPTGANHVAYSASGARVAASGNGILVFDDAGRALDGEFRTPDCHGLAYLGDELVVATRHSISRFGATHAPIPVPHAPPIGILFDPTGERGLLALEDGHVIRLDRSLDLASARNAFSWRIRARRCHIHLGDRPEDDFVVFATDALTDRPWRVPIFVIPGPEFREVLPYEAKTAFLQDPAAPDGPAQVLLAHATGVTLDPGLRVLTSFHRLVETVSVPTAITFSPCGSRILVAGVLSLTLLEAF